jgi:hypothetical protein
VLSFGAVGDLAGAISAFLTKAADFVDIFDLSFFVAGAVCLGALAFGNAHAHMVAPAAFGEGYNAIMFLVACYVMGLICFAFGRMLRPKKSSLFAADFKSIVERHGLGDRYQRYLTDRPEDNTALYNRFWACARHTAELAPSFNLLRRYWSMAATYDGVLTALIVWWAVIAHWCLDDNAHAPLPLRLIPLFILPIAIWICRREAGRLVRFQMEELVASIAAYEGAALAKAAEPIAVLK